MSKNDIVDDSIQKIWDDAITLVFSCNDGYVVHLYTVFNSIKNNNVSKRKYDVIILQNDISETNKESLVNKMGNENFSIRFFDMKRFFHGKKLPTHGRITIETYFRYYIPDIMAEYNKVLYLDVDIVVNSDLAELYDNDMNKNYIVATRDLGLICQYHSTKTRKNYFDNILKLKNANDYFQAGVMLLNIHQLKNNLDIDKIITITKSNHWEFMDQDVLNMELEGKVGFTGQEWNVALYTDEDFKDTPKELYQTYQNAKENPKIIHYAGLNKPWDTNDIMFIEYYMKYLYDKDSRHVSSKKNTLMSKFTRILKNNGLRSTIYSVFLWARNKIRK